MRSFRSKPVGWRGESYCHYLAAKGIKTKHNYNALFKLTGRRDVVEYSDPTGRKVLFHRVDPSKLRKTSDARMHAPDDVFYQLDEYPTELAPADVHVIPRRQFNIKFSDTILQDELELLNAKIEEVTTAKSSGEDVDLKYVGREGVEFHGKDYDSFLKKLVSERKRVAAELAKSAKEWEAHSGVFTGDVDIAGDKLNKGTLVHEGAHAVDAKLGDEGGWLSKDFKYRGPTEYGKKSEVEAFAETVTAMKKPGVKKLLWEDPPVLVVHPPSKEGWRFGKDYDDDRADSVWASSERHRLAVMKIDEAKKEKRDFKKAEKWVRQNVPNWDAPTAREKHEAKRKPKTLEAEGKLQHVRETGEYLSRKR